MEDKKLNERESLEHITRMIQDTRRNLDAGSGNMFLLWGFWAIPVLAMVVAAVEGGAPVSEYLSYFVTVIILSMIIPGHLLKYKVRKDVAKRK